MCSDFEDFENIFQRAPVLTGFNMDYINKIAVDRVLSVFPIKVKKGIGFTNIYEYGDIDSIRVALIFGTTRRKESLWYYIQIASNESDIYVKFEHDLNSAVEFVNRMIELEEMKDGLSYSVLEETDFDIKYDRD